MKPLYSDTPADKTPHRRGAIAAAKELVSTAELASELTLLERRGETWAGCCAIPDHDDRTPSFYIYPDNRWHCYGCNRGGDVVDLARLAWGYREQAMTIAAEDLLREFGHDVPEPRKPSRFRREVEEAHLKSIQRRVYRRALLPIIAGMEDGEERRAEERELWQEARRLAYVIRGGRARL